MKEIKINCTSGIKISIENLSIYPGKLKKHSLLEIERLCDSIVNDGFLFPLAVGKVKDKNASEYMLKKWGNNIIEIKNKYGRTDVVIKWKNVVFNLEEFPLF